MAGNLIDGRYYKLCGRLTHPSGNLYRIALHSFTGTPLVYFKGFYDYKMGVYNLYPEKIAVPGQYDLKISVPERKVRT